MHALRSIRRNGFVTLSGFRAGHENNVHSHPKNPRMLLSLATATGSLILFSTDTTAHTQPRLIPPKILDEKSKKRHLKMIDELKHACETIRSSVVETLNISHRTNRRGVDAASLNLMVQMIHTKEEYCETILAIVSHLLLCHRVQRTNFESEGDYVHALKAHHAVLVAATKTKEACDENACDEEEDNCSRDR